MFRMVKPCESHLKMVQNYNTAITLHGDIIASNYYQRLPARSLQPCAFPPCCGRASLLRGLFSVHCCLVSVLAPDHWDCAPVFAPVHLAIGLVFGDHAELSAVLAPDHCAFVSVFFPGH